MVSQFIDETTFEKREENHWYGHLNENWNIGNVPNGGYLLAVVLRAMKQQTTFSDLLSASAHFLRPGKIKAESEVEAVLLKEGNSISTCEGSMIQEQKLALKVVAEFGNLEIKNNDSRNFEIQPPILPPPEKCSERSSASQGIELPIRRRVEVRIAEMESDSQKAEVYGWIRFCDSTEPDSLALALFSDAFPPSIFSRLGRLGWVPTVQLSVQIRKFPTEGWLAGHFYTDDFQNGSTIETGRLWDSTGSLVAQSRQLALVKNKATRE